MGDGWRVAARNAQGRMHNAGNDYERGGATAVRLLSSSGCDGPARCGIRRCSGLCSLCIVHCALHRAGGAGQSSATEGRAAAPCSAFDEVPRCGASCPSPPASGSPIHDGWVDIVDGRESAGCEQGSGDDAGWRRARPGACGADAPASWNAHTHLELSYLDGAVPPASRFTGLDSRGDGQQARAAGSSRRQSSMRHGVRSRPSTPRDCGRG